MKLIVKIMLLVALLQVVMCTDHVYKLGADNGEDANEDGEDGAEDGNEDGDDLPSVEAKVGDVVILDLPQDKPEGETLGGGLIPIQDGLNLVLKK